MQWLAQLFDTTGFVGRWYCGRWTPFHGWLHIGADIAIFGAYALIPIALVYFTKRQPQQRFLPVFRLFAAFILACGFGHLIDATVFWEPHYRLLTLSKVWTGVISWITVLALIRVLPKALALDSMNAELDKRVQERTAELSAMVREREVLVREVHHRVKHNLQVVSSLINMQCGRLDEHGGRSALRVCQARVLAIARVHELLYRAHDTSRIPLPEYVGSLVAGLEEMGVASARVRIETYVDDVLLSVESGVPCGLILNELITNSLRHGFVADRCGVIRVSLLHSQPNELTLEVRDDGVGLPADFDTVRNASLGLTIVGRLASQLKGSLQVGRGPGASFTLVFPAADLAVRGQSKSPPALPDSTPALPDMTEVRA